MDFLAPQSGNQFAESFQTAAVVLSAIFQSPGWQEFIAGVKIFSFISSVLMIAVMIVLLIRMQFFTFPVDTIRTFLGPAAISGGKDKLTRDWEKIKARLRKDTPDDDRLALIESDRLFDSVLKEMRHPGETMAERLEAIKGWHLSNIEDVWQAHKLRNRIVHEPNARFSHLDIEAAVKSYENALKELGLLE